MTFESIFAFALVLLVAGNVALAWITFDLRQQVRAQASQHGTHERRFTTYAVKLGELQKTSPVNLAAEVAALAEAVARLRDTQRRFAGRVDQRLGRVSTPADQHELVDDGEFTAMLELQNAPSGRPNGG